MCFQKSILFRQWGGHHSDSFFEALWTRPFPSTVHPLHGDAEVHSVERARRRRNRAPRTGFCDLFEQASHGVLRRREGLRSRATGIPEESVGWGEPVKKGIFFCFVLLRFSFFIELSALIFCVWTFSSDHVCWLNLKFKTWCDLMLSVLCVTHSKRYSLTTFLFSLH